MPTTYVAFIDESGDEGFNLVKPPKRLSSEWFVMSAVLCKVAHEHAFKTACDAYLEVAGKKKPFHFADVRHEDRIGFLGQLVNVPFHHMSVLAHKPSRELCEAQMIGKQSHFLFYYTAKLLLERITWFCDYYCGGQDGNAVKIVFSDRGQLRRDRLLSYLGTLRARTETEDFLGVDVRNHDIKWKYIDQQLIEIEAHNSLPGLQAADAVASSLRSAIEFTPHFATEHRYAKLLAPRIWSRYFKVINYGLKFLPGVPKDEFSHTDRMHWLRHYRWPHIK